MKEKIAIRFLTQFLIMTCLRLFLVPGFYSEVNFQVFCLLVLYALILTILFETFDELIIRYIKYRHWITIAIILCYGFIFYYYPIHYLKIIFGYILVVLLKDIYTLTFMQFALKDYQTNYNDTKKNKNMEL